MPKCITLKNIQVNKSERLSCVLWEKVPVIIIKFSQVLNLHIFKTNFSSQPDSNIPLCDHLDIFYFLFIENDLKKSNSKTRWNFNLIKLGKWTKQWVSEAMSLVNFNWYFFPNNGNLKIDLHVKIVTKKWLIKKGNKKEWKNINDDAEIH